MKQHRVRWKKWGIGAVIVILGAALLGAPLPMKMERQLTGLAFSEETGAETTPCEVSMAGMKYCRLLKPDVFDGTFALSVDPRTFEQDARLNADIPSGDRASSMIYVSETSLIPLGYFLSDRDLSWVFIRTRDAEGNIRDIAAPAQTLEEAQAIREKAASRVHGNILPEYG